MREFVKQTDMPVSAATLYRWHLRPGAFQRLTPAWAGVRLLEKPVPISEGSTVRLRLAQGFNWVAQHKHLKPDQSFTDVQVRGPFASWEHMHKAEASSETQCRLVDQVLYSMPLHPLGHWFAQSYVHAHLERLFKFRHQRTLDDLVRHQIDASQPMKHVGITGANGLIGRHLAAYLSSAGHRVDGFLRGQAPADLACSGTIHRWTTDVGTLALELEGMDAVIHLAGAPISQRWTATGRRHILESRIESTANLSKALASMERPPSLFICASGIGYYGRGIDNRFRTENDGSGPGFAADVCQKWEEATQLARDAGIRVVNLRIGIVLSSEGGALRKLLPAFQYGFGGPVGTGSQWMSWISLDDLLAIIETTLYDDRVRGAINACSPNPVLQLTFAQTLARILRRPAIFPLPAAWVKLLFGPMGEELVLEGLPVLPTRLLELGFPFIHPTLDHALHHELGV